MIPSKHSDGGVKRSHAIQARSPRTIVLMLLLCLSRTQAFTSPMSRMHPLKLTYRYDSFIKRNALVPLEVDELKQLLSTGAPTASQYSTYWGRTSKEQYEKWNESALVALLGSLFSYCLSFVFGSFVATLLGVVCVTWIILGPEVQAYQRNWELLGGRPLIDPWIADDAEDGTQGLFGALFVGSVVDATVVEDASANIEYDLDDFEGYTMEYDQLEQLTGLPYLLRLRLDDSDGRTLQVHARLSEEYLDIRPNHQVSGIVLSTSQRFASLAALTDFVVPKAQCWVGDYPYLDRPALERLLAEDDDIWAIFEEEGALEGSSDDPSSSDDHALSRENLAAAEKVKVPHRRNRRR